MECDSVVRGRKPSFMEESTGEDNDVQSEVESDDEDDNWLFLGTRSAAVLACYVTSPEELSNRKILLEEYEEAIMLAKHSGLDTDPLYSRQWQQGKKSMASIHDYQIWLR